MDANTLIQCMLEHYDIMLYCAFKRLRNMGDAEDVVQDVCLRILENKPNEINKAYLMVSVVNTCILFQRSEVNHHNRNKNYFDAFVGDAQITNDRLVNMEVHMNFYQTLNAAVQKLSTVCRQVFEMHYFQGLSYADISRLTGWNDSTVRNHGLRALNIVKNFLHSNGYTKSHQISEIIKS